MFYITQTRTSETGKTKRLVNAPKIGPFQSIPDSQSYIDTYHSSEQVNWAVYYNTQTEYELVAPVKWVLINYWIFNNKTKSFVFNKGSFYIDPSMVGKILKVKQSYECYTLEPPDKQLLNEAIKAYSFDKHLRQREREESRKRKSLAKLNAVKIALEERKKLTSTYACYGFVYNFQTKQLEIPKKSGKTHNWMKVHKINLSDEDFLIAKNGMKYKVHIQNEEILRFDVYLDYRSSVRYYDPSFQRDLRALVLASIELLIKPV